MKKPLICIAGVVALSFQCGPLGAEEFVPNYDEAKVPEYKLPDPLTGVKSAEGWTAKRSEIYTLIEREMFGQAPRFEGAISFSEGIEKFEILEGKAVVSQPVLDLAGKKLQLLVILPRDSEEKVPAFIGYNFNGNHTVLDDKRVSLARGWVGRGKENKAQESDRGSSASRWSVKQMIDSGFGLVTLYYGDVDPDFHDEFKNGIFEKYGVPKPHEWGSIGAWAWSLSRVLDFLEQNDRGIDPKHVAVFGHSRLGKTSLWAGASDERFALVISNDSGCGGAALSKRAYGETVWRINNSFPHWFCGNFMKYGNNEAEMPFDSHMLIALMAPRPVYVASAEKDRWADPHGEFLACVGADPVYRLLGTEGLPSKEFPKVNEPVQGRIGYHIRTGSHDVTDYDWEQYIKFAKKHFK
jgi:hypothetical protein